LKPLSYFNTMGRILFLLFVLLLGFTLRRLNIANKSHASFLNRLIIFFFIPLITLLNIPELELSKEMLWLTISPFFVFLFGWLFFFCMSKYLNLEKKTTQALILTGGISSTSFVGFPIFELLYGDLGLSYGVLLSMGGTILVFNTLGMGLLLRYVQNSYSLWGLIKGILTFIPFLIFALSLILNLTSLSLSHSMREVMSFLVSPFSVVALFAVGMQVELRSMKSLKVELLLGQFYKLVLAPILMFSIGLLFYEPDNLIFKIGVLGAGIGSMHAMSILTAEKNIKPELAIAMPAIGIPISVFTLFIIHFIIG